jgi:NAD(P)-dependent dehydrogenase (short-subunit alcohol dehydrogenase family)
MSKFDFTPGNFNKNIIVTGASSGIGSQCAISCSTMGARIVLMGRDKVRLKKTLSQMTGDGHFIFSVDLLDYTEVERAVGQIIEKDVKIDGLINCAGISTTLSFSLSKPDKMEQFFRTNVIGAMNLTRLIVKKGSFSDKGGSIIFISSVMGSAGEVGKSLYSMTKGAIDAGVRSLAIELAPKKIRVNSISPGVVITPMSQNAVYNRDEESLNKVKALHPLGLGQPDDVANACIYLLSDASRWVTGTNLIVDGGYLAR